MVWFFDRDGQRLRYEIRRAANASGYEVALTFPDGQVQTEQSPDAVDLLERCAHLADALKHEGWRPA